MVKTNKYNKFLNTHLPLYYIHTAFYKQHNNNQNHFNIMKHERNRKRFIKKIIAAGTLCSKEEYEQSIAKWLEVLRMTKTVYEKSQAEYSIGICYHKLNQDNQAVVWYRKAAEHGDGMAQVFVGDSYAGGISVEQSDEEARRWYSIAQETFARDEDQFFVDLWSDLDTQAEDYFEQRLQLFKSNL